MGTKMIVITNVFRYIGKFFSNGTTVTDNNVIHG